MQNLTPHRRFKGSSLSKACFRPFYKRPWPEDLPSECVDCGTPFRTNWNLDISPNKAGRFLKKAAYYSVLPCMLGAFIAPFLFESIVRRMTDGNGGWWFLAVVSTPPLLAFLSLLTPLKRHLECKKCGWNHDFNTRKQPDLDPGSKEVRPPPSL